MNLVMMIDSLSELSDSELKELKTAIDYRLHIEKKHKDIEFLYEIVITKMKEKNLIDSSPSFTIFKKVKKESYKQLVTTHEYIDSYISNILKKKLSKVERVKFYRLYVNIMLEYIGNISTPNINILLNSYSNFPSAIGSFFPGYAESGLLGFLFTEKEE